MQDVHSLALWRRLSAVVSLLLHLLVVGAGPVVDARLEVEAAASKHAPVHVEDANSGHCTTGHDHQFCLVCRALQSLDTPPEHTSPPLAGVLSLTRLVGPAVVAPTTAVSSSPLGARAPPAV